MKTTTAAALCVLAAGISGQAGAPADSSVADAARRGDEAAVRDLLSHGADVQTAHPDGMTALHWAAQGSFVAVAAVLIDAGANLDAVTRIGHHTPLHVASDVVRVLLAAGSDRTSSSPW